MNSLNSKMLTKTDHKEIYFYEFTYNNMHIKSHGSHQLWTQNQMSGIIVYEFQQGRSPVDFIKEKWQVYGGVYSKVILIHVTILSQQLLYIQVSMIEFPHLTWKSNKLAMLTDRSFTKMNVKNKTCSLVTTQKHESWQQSSTTEQKPHLLTWYYESLVFTKALQLCTAVSPNCCPRPDLSWSRCSTSPPPPNRLCSRQARLCRRRRRKRPALSPRPPVPPPPLLREARSR